MKSARKTIAATEELATDCGPQTEEFSSERPNAGYIQL
jgi:hypothetical protein